MTENQRSDFSKMWERDSGYRTKNPIAKKCGIAIVDSSEESGWPGPGREWIFISLLFYFDTNLITLNKLVSSIIHFHKTDNFEKKSHFKFKNRWCIMRRVGCFLILAIFIITVFEYKLLDFDNSSRYFNSKICDLNLH